MILELELFPTKIHLYKGGASVDLIRSFESILDKEGNPLKLTKAEKEDIASSLDTDDDLGFCLELEDATGHYIFWVKEYNGSPLDIATVTHEAAHCTFQILRRAGINTNEETEELFCYLQDWIVRRAIEWLRDGDKNTYRTERPV